MSDYLIAFLYSIFFLILFVLGFWLGVHWQIKRDLK